MIRLSSLTGYVKTAVLQDVRGHGVEFALSHQPDHQGEEGGFPEIVQLEAEQGSDRAGSFGHILTLQARQKVFQALLHPGRQRAVAGQAVQNDRDLLVEYGVVQQTGFAKFSSHQRPGSALAAAGNLPPQLIDSSAPACHMATRLSLKQSSMKVIRDSSATIKLERPARPSTRTPCEK